VLFGPQKGAGPGQVALLTRRLEEQAEAWARDLGTDVRSIPGTGAAGGAGGAVAVLGGSLRSGYGLVAGLVGLTAALDTADRAVTGEGALDAGSFAGKVVGGVMGDARARGIPTLVVVGRASVDASSRAEGDGCTVVSLVGRFGTGRAFAATLDCVEEATADWLGRPRG
jgi:glycerate kinase